MSIEDKRKYKHIITRASLGLLILSTASTGVVATTAQKSRLILTNKDKASIISHILKRELIGKGMSSANQTLYLSTENIVDALKTGFAPSNLVLLTPNRIQEVGSQKNGFHYLYFSRPEVKKDRVRITLVNNTIKDGTEGTVYECKKGSGRWTCRGIEGFNISGTKPRLTRRWTGAADSGFSTLPECLPAARSAWPLGA